MEVEQFLGASAEMKYGAASSLTNENHHFHLLPQTLEILKRCGKSLPRNGPLDLECMGK